MIHFRFAEQRNVSHINPLGQILAFTEGPNRTFINAHSGIKLLVKNLPQRLILTQNVICAQKGVKLGGEHHLFYAVIGAHHKHIAALVAVRTHHALQHVNAAKIAGIHMIQAHEQITLIRVRIGIGGNEFFDVVHCAKVQIAIHFNNRQLRARLPIRSINKVAKFVIWQNRLDSRGAGAPNVEDERKDDAQQNGKLNRQKERPHQGHYHDGRISRMAAPDAGDFCLVDHAIGGNDEYARESRNGQVSRQRGEGKQSNEHKHARKNGGHGRFGSGGKVDGRSRKRTGTRITGKESH